VLSNSVDAFEGARAAVLHAPGLFRLDVTLIPDSMRVVVRNMSAGPLTCSDEGYGRPVAVQGDTATIAALHPGHHQTTFTLGEPGDAVEVRVILATLRLRDRGMVRISGQATVRRAG
jgi:hypothetical protein